MDKINHKKSDLEALAKAFKEKGIFALLQASYVDQNSGSDWKKESSYRIATLNTMVIDAIEFAAKHGED